MFSFPLFHKKCQKIYIKLNHSVNFFPFWEIAGEKCLVPFINVKNHSQIYLFICVYSIMLSMFPIYVNTLLANWKSSFTPCISVTLWFIWLKSYIGSYISFFPLNWMRLRKSSIDWPLQVRKIHCIISMLCRKTMNTLLILFI